ncbi:MULTISPECIES: lysophospholipid acyltransferase family protein [unclassified Inquilinus]|uniref:lysophospholipid acyltransferase family protein n=1 Tax=unclassified Inquilinus TaxID=2645927 RepID=UPI003F905D26
MPFPLLHSLTRQKRKAPAWPVLRRRILDLAVATPVYLLFAIFRLLPIGAASALGGWIGRSIGPGTGASRHADANLRLVLPDLSAADRLRIVTGMWDNLGRMVGEFPHLAALRRREARAPKRIRVEGFEHLEAARAGGRAVVFAVAHFGNWEISPIAAANLGLSLTAFYRPLRNRLIDALLRRIRESLGTRLLEKRMEGNGAKQALSILREGGVLGMLVDQRYTGGLAVPFFGRDALTSPAAVALAYHVRCDVLPVRFERRGGAYFDVVFEAPLPLARTGDRAADIEAGTRALNQRVEAWVRTKPEQWLWLHKRWYHPPPRKPKYRNLQREQALPPTG